MADERPTESTDRTPWSGRHVTLPGFLRTEAASAGVLLAGVLGAIVWFNVDGANYESVWNTGTQLSLGTHRLSLSLRDVVDEGLMTIFFLVVGLEARREFDLGDLRDRRRFVLPLTAGLLGMAVPIAIYLAILSGRSGSDGWGTAMSTDTALALGALSLLGKRVPSQVRLFLLTVFVVDDIVSLLVIAFFYSERIHPWYLLATAVGFGCYFLVRRAGTTRGVFFALVGVVTWVLMVHSGVDPVVLGLLLGLAAPAFTPLRDNLDRALGFVRTFREQPTPELARRAVTRLNATQSPNARLQTLYDPWSSFVIVPIFALANIGVSVSPGALADAFGDPITIGVLVGYVVGKPVAVVGAAAALRALSHGRIRPPVGWLSVTGSGTVAGVGFTVSVLVATRAFHGQHLQDAKTGALAAVIAATLLTAVAFGGARLFRPPARARALLGASGSVVDLVEPVDEKRDHIRGPLDAPVTLVEYGDFECPYCGRAEPIVREVLAAHELDVRYVWRHLPLGDVHPHAQLAAVAAEAAAAQDAFWPMRDRLIAPNTDLTETGLADAARSLGLDEQRFLDDLAGSKATAHVAADVESADLSGVTGTPTFFVNGLRHHGAYDAAALKAAVDAARLRALASAAP